MMSGLGDLNETTYENQLSDWNGTIIGPQNVRRQRQCCMHEQAGPRPTLARVLFSPISSCVALALHADSSR